MLSDELYFMAVLTEALSNPEPQTSLPGAFEKIRRLGKRQQYREGFENFGYFMNRVFSRYETVEKQYWRSMIIEEAAKSLGDGTINNGGADSVCKDEWETINAHVQQSARSLHPVIDLFCGAAKIDRLTFAKDITTRSVCDIAPGFYALKLDTGRLLWEGQFTAGDLIWEDAFKGKDVRLAADSEGLDQGPTRRIDLLDGQMAVSIFAGIESGAIELEVKGNHGN